MTNFEFYKDELLKITTESSVALINGKPVCCSSIVCEVCDFYRESEIKNTSCGAELVEWLYQEHEPHVDWSKVEVDTPIYVKDDGEEWQRRHFAKYENGKVYAFRNGFTSWTCDTAPIPWDYAKLKEVEE